MTLIFFTKLDKIYGEERRGENREGIDTGPLEKFSSLKSLQLYYEPAVCVLKRLQKVYLLRKIRIMRIVVQQGPIYTPAKSKGRYWSS